MEEENCIGSISSAMQKKMQQLYQALWIFETTGSKDAQDLYTSLQCELKSLLSNEECYQALLSKKTVEQNPIASRSIDILLLAMQENRLPVDLLEKIAHKESELMASFITFRADFENNKVSDNDLLTILKTEKKVERRQACWEASKQIGMELAPKIKELVIIRNQAAHRLGYSDFYDMQLKLQEIDKTKLFATLEELKEQSNQAYNETLKEINTHLSKRFKVSETSLGPWAWADPFCQEDPILDDSFDALVADVDFIDIAKQFYKAMQLPIDDILKQSDLLERPGKNQHAFCISMDRAKDVRILTNLRPTIKWLEVLLHELGHAVYEQYYDPQLPWLLKTPAHMITTEAIALLMGRQAYKSVFLQEYCAQSDAMQKIIESIEASHKRRQLIFSRWVMVMVHFESQLYANPEQNLNVLWWRLVQQYQGILPTQPRTNHCDWAAKYHIGLAPVYYHSYLLGEMFASMLLEIFSEKNTQNPLKGPFVGHFLKDNLFAMGNRMRWDQLIQRVTKSPLSANAWIKEFT